MPSIAEFEDKRVTSGLKFITGGAKYNKTGGGWMNDGLGTKVDYVADATAQVGKDILTVRGFCANFSNADEYYSSSSFTNWVNENNLN